MLCIEVNRLVDSFIGVDEEADYLDESSVVGDMLRANLVYGIRLTICWYAYIYWARKFSPPSNSKAR